MCSCNWSNVFSRNLMQSQGPFLETGHRSQRIFRKKQAKKAERSLHLNLTKKSNVLFVSAHFSAPKIDKKKKKIQRIFGKACPQFKLLFCHWLWYATFI